MGSIFTSEYVDVISPIDDDSLILEERESVFDLFDHQLKSETYHSSKFSTIFKSDDVPEFSHLLFSYICGEDNILTLEKFKRFIVKTCRTSPYNALESMWLILSENNSKSNAVILLQYLTLIHEICGGQNDCRENDVANILRHIKTFASHRNTPHHNAVADSEPKVDDVNIAIDINTFLQWSNEYAPNIPKLIITYFTKICFKNKSKTSFEPFSIPHLEGKSTVLRECSMFPLSLYSSHMQGKWIKLYSTDSDGRSFNRIAHHILGYGVNKI